MVVLGESVYKEQTSVIFVFFLMLLCSFLSFL
jgi:hypothetical protein